MGTTNCEGIWLTGDHLVIRRVKVINLTSQNAEIFPIRIEGGRGLSGGNVATSEGNIIEGCEVNLPNITWVSAICLSGNATHYATGAVRNNRVVLGACRPQPLAAFNCGYDHDLVIEGNYVEGGNWGVYAEASFANLMIHHNTFRNITAGVYLYINGSTNVICAFNSFELGASRGDAYAFFFRHPYSFRNIQFIGNTIQFSGAPPSGKSFALSAASANGVSFLNNIMDRRLLLATAGSTGVKVYNNSDLVGAPMPINQDPARAIERTTVNTSGSYMVQYADRYVGIRNVGLNSVLLPSAAGWAGKEFVISREDGAASFTLFSRGGFINGTNALPVPRGSGLAASATVVSDGTNWYAR
jgi:hypothetical protein